jgi:1-acyl-sn-glycerol-3-phosphate acyltransferase
MTPTYRFPELPPSLPRRGNWFSRTVAQFGMRLFGWTVTGCLPDIKKAVIIVAPHTSNWDFIVGVLAMFALSIRVSFLGKDTLFRPPFGLLFRWLGGFPVDRSSPSGVVEQTVDEFNRATTLALALSPEGTRSRSTRWRTGFYHIAVGAVVPIVPVALDFANKNIRLGQPVEMTGEMEADLAGLESFFANATGLKPELATRSALAGDG